jgi:hypothetical protein
MPFPQGPLGRLMQVFLLLLVVMAGERCKGGEPPGKTALLDLSVYDAGRRKITIPRDASRVSTSTCLVMAVGKHMAARCNFYRRLLSESSAMRSQWGVRARVLQPYSLWSSSSTTISPAPLSCCPRIAAFFASRCSSASGHPLHSSRRHPPWPFRGDASPPSSVTRGASLSGAGQ